MSKILSVDNMLEAAIDSQMPGASDYVRAVEAIGTALARSLASHLKVGTTFADLQLGFGGTCAPFFALEAGQECPKVIDTGDEGGEWDVASAYMPEAPDDAPATLSAAVAMLVKDALAPSERSILETAVSILEGNGNTFDAGQVRRILERLVKDTPSIG